MTVKVVEPSEPPKDSTVANSSDSEQSSPAQKMFVTLSYMAVSSLMLMVNKLSVHFLPKPGIVLFLQFAFSAVCAWAIGASGTAEVDALEWAKIRKFWPAVCAQIATVFTGMKALQYSNVETFIVFRASMPIVLCILDFLFLGRELPSKRSAACLAGMLLGASIYTLTDSALEVRAYFWIAIWYSALCFDFTYMKYIVSNVPMTTYGRVYYQNSLGSVGLFIMAVLFGELGELNPVAWGTGAWVAIIVGCMLGMGMSTFSYRLRAMTSSTQMAIIGNVCKVLTVVINFAIWDKHASPAGLFSLLICLVAAYFYQEAPMREDIEGAADAKLSKQIMVVGAAVILVGGLVAVASSGSPLALTDSLQAPCPVGSSASDAWVGNGISESSGGKLFKATKLRTFTGKMRQWEDRALSEPLQPQGSLNCDKWAVVTTIFSPTKAMKQLETMEGWCQVIVGDKKTPVYPELKNTVYLDPSAQEALPYVTPGFLKWNHFGRKNVGFLYAVHHGAQLIYDYDDDNELKPGMTAVPELPLSDSFHKDVLYVPAESNIAMVNPYINFGKIQVKESEPKELIHAWPRGFPLEQIHNKTVWDADTPKAPASMLDSVAVLQSLADHDPDMDGVYRLTQKLPLKFMPTSDALILDHNVMSPWNAQAVVIAQPAFFTMLLPITVHGRVTDIWRSYMSNRLLADAGKRVAFSKPWADQYRNAHDYMADFNSELPLYQTSQELVKALRGWTSSAPTMAGRLEDLAIFMYEYGFLELDDIHLYQSWISDLFKIGYEFPLVV